MDSATLQDLEQLETDIDEIGRILGMLRPDGSEYDFWRRCVDKAIDRRRRVLLIHGGGVRPGTVPTQRPGEPRTIGIG